MTDPTPPARRMFFDETHTSEHLCDHVLTRPEAHDWALLLPNYRQHVDPTDDVELRNVAASLFTAPPGSEAALALRQEYVEALLRTVDDALRLGMWWEQCSSGDRFWVGLGLQGVLIVWDARVLRSGYLPRQSTLPPGGPVPARTANPLPRRDLRRRLAPPPPDTLRQRYELFQAGVFSASRLYELAYNNQEIRQAGGEAFVTRPPRIGRWQELLVARPGVDARAARGGDGTTGCQPS